MSLFCHSDVGEAEAKYGLGLLCLLKELLFLVAQLLLVLDLDWQNLNYEKSYHV